MPDDKPETDPKLMPAKLPDAEADPAEEIEEKGAPAGGDFA